MRNNQNLEWCVNLCKANKKMMQSSEEHIRKIVKEYPILKKVTDFLLARTDYQSAEYNMASRFLKKYA